MAVRPLTVQPSPLKSVAVSPTGKVSTRLTVPLVAPAPELVTVMAYVSPASPCWKLPESAILTVRSGGGSIVTVSVAVSLEVLVSPPPETVAVLVTLPEVVEATSTVSVNVG